MKLYRTTNGLVVEQSDRRCILPAHFHWDDLLLDADIYATLDQQLQSCVAPLTAERAGTLLKPIVSQEVWAAGVTYIRSREARVLEAQTSGGGASAGDFYERVYEADRPEIFFKATPHRVAGPGENVRIRADSNWNVPEPELAMLVNSRGRVIGYTIGNDMSSRDIEGQNPLYLPQAKTYDGCCALGPCVLISDEPPSMDTEIIMRVRRSGIEVFAGHTALSQMKRGFQELVDYLFRDNSFPNGCYLLTGTGVVPPDAFSLHAGDEIAITIEPIGTLVNKVVMRDQ